MNPSFSPESYKYLEGDVSQEMARLDLHLKRCLWLQGSQWPRSQARRPVVELIQWRHDR